jgi:hypothetical protein
MVVCPYRGLLPLAPPLWAEKSHSAPIHDIDNIVFLMDFDKSAYVIIRKNDKRSFLVVLDKRHTLRNVKKINEIIFRLFDNTSCANTLRIQ